MSAQAAQASGRPQSSREGDADLIAGPKALAYNKRLRAWGIGVHGIAAPASQNVRMQRAFTGGCRLLKCHQV